jgi:hypothetical protein
MSITPNLALAYIVSGQAQKEVTHNDALNDLDLLVHCAALDRTLNAPPVSPAMGDVYIVGASPTGSWSGQEGKIAGFYSGWKFKQAEAGWRVWLRSENRLLVFNGTGWSNLSALQLEASFSWTPGLIAVGAGLNAAAVTVAGAAFGDFVQVAAPYDLQGLTATAYVNASNSVIVRLQNGTGAGVTLASGNWRLRIHKQ